MFGEKKHSLLLAKHTDTMLDDPEFLAAIDERWCRSVAAEFELRRLTLPCFEEDWAFDSAVHSRTWINFFTDLQTRVRSEAVQFLVSYRVIADMQLPSEASHNTTVGSFSTVLGITDGFQCFSNQGATLTLEESMIAIRH